MSDAFVPDGIDNPDPAHVHAFETFLDATLGPTPEEEPEQLELDVEVKFDWLAMAADRLDQLGTRLATEHQPRLSTLWRFPHCETCRAEQFAYVPATPWPCPVARTILDHVGLPKEQIKLPTSQPAAFVKDYIARMDQDVKALAAARGVPVIWVTDGAGGWIKPEPAKE